MHKLAGTSAAWDSTKFRVTKISFAESPYIPANAAGELVVHTMIVSRFQEDVVKYILAY
jgi:hypothetical protein